MQIVFISNIMTPHQRLLCNCIAEQTEGFLFLETQIRSSDIPIGWREEIIPDYVRTEEWYRNRPEEVRRIIMQADIVIIGSAPDKMIVERLKAGKITFRYSERFYKTGTPLRRFLRDAAAAWLHHGRFQKYPLYLLCASAYTAGDAARFGNYKDRCYVWGYFPEFRQYDNVDELLGKKKKNTLLWAGRLIDWKHPDDAVCLAERLRDEGYDFCLNIIGTGEMEPLLHTMIREKKLEGYIHMLGAMKPERVREHMENAQVFLFTSDRQEGWGAVLNEAMNSGCAVVANRDIGSVPFLLRDEENGLTYHSGDMDMLYEKVKTLLDDPGRCRALGREAYNTISKEWNVQEAAQRLIILFQTILDGCNQLKLYESGPCSKVENTH